jgi:hypothetical protein
VIIAMIAVRVMQPSIHQKIGVITMWNNFRLSHMGLRIHTLKPFADIRVHRINLQPVLINAHAFDVMQMTIVYKIDMIAVLQ